MNRLPAMEYELNILKLRTLVEAVKIYEFNDFNDIPPEFQEIYNLGKRIHILMTEMEHLSK